MKLTLTAVRQEPKSVYSFFFQSKELTIWQAGQYLRYHIDDLATDSRGENRFFSIASAPLEKQIQLTTRIDPDKGSSFKKNLLSLTPGDEISAAGPNGAFIVEDPSDNFVFVAGGIGITPFRAIILDLYLKSLPINITLFYANKNSELIFQKELEEISSTNPKFKIHYFVGENILTPQIINQLVPHSKTSLFYISGPEPMMTSFEKSFIQMGISENKIKHDYFPGYTDY